ncbi:hypothetical protein [Roseibacillus persicicus]|uniref:Uncharacterized protein n=1 Tax=Roseibacillus persicicus TaxID=454148 RepID=A0A918THD8_9BACT|nr:hypothetical protein [Roseibacillus persicicus]GHC46154.1 hypothetical protein GCM10007100_09610 [Roseibacillus persicicus]
MAREVLVVVGLVVFAAAFRACRKNWTRKLGALVFLVASFLALYFLTHNIWAGMLAVLGWFFLPWIELLTRVRKMRLPIDNQLQHRDPPEDEFFPNASRALAAMSDAHFEHVGDSAWKWAGMEQYFRLHWNPEERAVATVCLCEQDNVAFAFLAITSRAEDGRIFRTTNFPFSPTLKNPPGFHCKHVPCERNCFHLMLQDHQSFLAKMKVTHDDLTTPDPENLEDEIEEEMRVQIEHNLQHGIIERTNDGHFRYSVRGLFFLWKQFAKDMIRLC